MLHIEGSLQHGSRIDDTSRFPYPARYFRITVHPEAVMDHLFFVVFREPDYRRCLMSNPPMLANHDEDRIGASVFRDLIGERNLVLTPGFPDLRRFPRADIVIGFDLAALQSPQAIAFSALQNAYITAMEQEEPLTEPQVLSSRARCSRSRDSNMTRLS